MVRPGVTPAPHRLEGIVERYLVLSGKGIVEVGDLPPEAVGPGAVVLIPSGVPQRIRNEREEDLVFYCICSPAFEQERYTALE